MLPVQARLRRSEDFRTASRRGRSSGQPHLVVHLLTQHSVSDIDAVDVVDRAPKVGFVVSKAIGNAVERNRVRRQLRHLCAARLSWLPPGSVLVVRAKPVATRTSSAVMGGELDDALRRLVGPASFKASV